jgi:hypothetical protein
MKRFEDNSSKKYDLFIFSGMLYNGYQYSITRYHPGGTLASLGGDYWRLIELSDFATIVGVVNTGGEFRKEIIKTKNRFGDGISDYYGGFHTLEDLIESAEKHRINPKFADTLKAFSYFNGEDN